MIDMDLVRRQHQMVGDRVQAEQNARRSRGDAALAGEGERQYARAVIADVIGSYAVERLGRGDAPLEAATEEEMAEAIFARMFGAGRLQKLLDDESIENIDINGADEVWISRAGEDYQERAEPVAQSDEELVELVQTLASYAGLSSRPFDSANPHLDLQLPELAGKALFLRADSCRTCWAQRTHTGR